MNQPPSSRPGHGPDPPSPYFSSKPISLLLIALLQLPLHFLQKEQDHSKEDTEPRVGLSQFPTQYATQLFLSLQKGTPEAGPRLCSCFYCFPAV